MSRNASNERSEVNYIEELKKDQRFCPSTRKGKVKRWGRNEMERGENGDLKS